MKCCQCSSVALYLVGEEEARAPLCLSCWSRLQEVTFLQWLQNAAMINQANDDMDAVMGFGPRMGRIPVAEIARAASRSRTYNNIQISNSTVGVLNTGNLARIDAAITISQGTDTEEFGARLADLTQAIVNDTKASAELKQQMLEVAQAISDQAITSKKPSDVVVTTLFGRLKELASNTAVVAEAVEKLHQAWTHLQGML